jgi:FAD/FMN-containing dehydrogenase
VVITTKSSDEARDVIDATLPLEPASLDFYSRSLFDEAASLKPAYKLEDSAKTKTGAVLVAAFDDVRQATRTSKIKKLCRQLDGLTEVSYQTSNDDNYSELAAYRNVVATYLNTAAEGKRRLPVVDGASISLAMLGEYLAGVKALEKRLAISLPVYGSALDGIYNIRPAFDLTKMTDRQLVFRILKEYASMVQGVDGNITGDGPEGRIRGLVSYDGLDERLVDLYKHIHEIFDPNGILNQGVKARPKLSDLIANMRSDYAEPTISE